MKQMTEYNRVSGYLVKIFKMLNERYFENALSIPVITIQSTPKAYGHITVGKTWLSDGQFRHELNIGAGTLNRPIDEVVATMLHEMVHLWNILQGVKDTSRGYTYHNKRFKEEAEKRDLIIEHHEKAGWTITTPSDALIAFCIEHELEEIKVSRIEVAQIVAKPPRDKEEDEDGDGNVGKPIPKKPSSTRKLVCPECGNSVRATKKLTLICGDCYAKNSKIVYFAEA